MVRPGRSCPVVSGLVGSSRNHPCTRYVLKFARLVSMYSLHRPHSRLHLLCGRNLCPQRKQCLNGYCFFWSEHQQKLVQRYSVAHSSVLVRTLVIGAKLVSAIPALVTADKAFHDKSAAAKRTTAASIMQTPITAALTTSSPDSRPCPPLMAGQ
jgi:hypothetical protein